MHKYARDAYNMGIRYIGGCCGIEPYHMRAVAEEVSLAKISPKYPRFLKSISILHCRGNCLEAEMPLESVFSISQPFPSV